MYEHIAPSYDQLHSAEQRRKLRSLLQHVDSDRYTSVVDVGAATAHLHTFFTNMRYVAVEPCKQLLEQAPSTVQTVLESGERMSFSDEEFDMSLSLTALHNYEDPISGVRELARVTKYVSLIGVLKKSPQHSSILEATRQTFGSCEFFSDQHDTLVVAYKQRNS